ncbi:COV 3-like protein [Tanacetum coccineum]|uniref:COV 3-like protein n=1 Tax=Tanacetum coccineum TaxID=301880 RepID=A0ABQ5ETF5_9ASTR
MLNKQRSLLVCSSVGALNRKHKIMGTRDKDRDLERLIPETGLTDNIIASPLSPLQSDTPPGTSSPFSHNAGKEFYCKVAFIKGNVVLLQKYQGLFMDDALFGCQSYELAVRGYCSQGSHAFKEVAIIRHPSVGEYAMGFITSTVTLRKNTGVEELCCVYVPTNHLYLGDIVLVNSKDVMKPNISVREGIEIIISGGMSMPKMLSTKDLQYRHGRSPSLEKFVIPNNFSEQGRFHFILEEKDAESDNLI